MSSRHSPRQLLRVGLADIEQWQTRPADRHDPLAWQRVGFAMRSGEFYGFAVRRAAPLHAAVVALAALRRTRGSDVDIVRTTASSASITTTSDDDVMETLGVPLLRRERSRTRHPDTDLRHSDRFVAAESVTESGATSVASAPTKSTTATTPSSAQPPERTPRIDVLAMAAALTAKGVDSLPKAPAAARKRRGAIASKPSNERNGGAVPTPPPHATTPS